MNKNNRVFRCDPFTKPKEMLFCNWSLPMIRHGSTIILQKVNRQLLSGERKGKVKTRLLFDKMFMTVFWNFKDFLHERCTINSAYYCVLLESKLIFKNDVFHTKRHCSLWQFQISNRPPNKRKNRKFIQDGNRTPSVQSRFVTIWLSYVLFLEKWTWRHRLDHCCVSICTQLIEYPPSFYFWWWNEKIAFPLRKMYYEIRRLRRKMRCSCICYNKFRFIFEPS